MAYLYNENCSITRTKFRRFGVKKLRQPETASARNRVRRLYGSRPHPRDPRHDSFGVLIARGRREFRCITLCSACFVFHSSVLRRVYQSSPWFETRQHGSNVTPGEVAETGVLHTVLVFCFVDMRRVRKGRCGRQQ